MVAMSFPSRRQKIAIVTIYLLLMIARIPTLIVESFWFNIGFLIAQAVALIVVVWAFGKILVGYRS
jgi:hypothetical protein